MKIAFGTSSAVDMPQALLGEVNYTSLWQGATKIWPSGRVSKIVLKLKTMNNVVYSNGFYHNEPWAYFMHAVGRASGTATEYVEVKVGTLVWQLSQRYNNEGYPFASYSIDTAKDTLIITFAKGTGPLLGKVKVNDNLSIKVGAVAWSQRNESSRAQMPVNTADYFIKFTNYPFIAGTKVELKITATSNPDKVWSAVNIGGLSLATGDIYNTNIRGLLYPTPSTVSTHTLTATMKNSSVWQKIALYDEYRWMTEGVGVRVTARTQLDTNKAWTYNEKLTTTITYPTFTKNYVFTVQSITQE